MVAVKVGEDPVLVLERLKVGCGRCVLDCGHASSLVAMLRGSGDRAERGCGG